MKTISDIVLNLEKYDKTALVYKTGYRTFTFSYSDLYQNVLKTYTLLDTLKLQKGDTIILWGYNSPYWGMVFLAAAMKGVIVVPIDYLATSEFVEKNSAHCKSKIHLSLRV